MENRTIIAGGGLAGLAAAAALADRGVPITLLESRPRLGGRASSFLDRATGTPIDNCQHVSMGCCTNFRHFCETVGIADFFRTETELFFIGPDRTVNRLAAGYWPAPLHLLSAFLRFSYLGREERSAIARGLRQLARWKPSREQPQTMAEWLREHNQPPAVIERFWRVVLVSALSESLDRIDVAEARKVFVDAFLANRRGWQIQVPTVPLDDLYGTHLTAWLTSRGVTVRLQAGVERIVIDGDRVTGVKLRSGEHVAADHLVLAVPFHLVLSLLPEPVRSHPSLARVAQLESAPISSVHLWFDRPVMNLPHAVLVERLSQWIFNRTALQGESPPPGPEPAAAEFYYQVVISASRNLGERSSQETIAEVVRELAEIWPETSQARLVHSRLVTEHTAVFSVKPGAADCRPPQQSHIPNLQLAGDWTSTGWPATMEGAVRSGYLAAENVLAQLGRPERLLEPDLPVSPLSRILLGL